MARLVEEYLAVVRKVGFENLRVGCLAEVFSGSEDEPDTREFDTRGIVFSAQQAF